MIRSLFLGSYPELIIFDLDGTLVDSAPDLAQAIDKMLLALSLPVAGLDNVMGWVGNGASVLVRRALVASLGEGRVDKRFFEQAYALFFQYYGEATVDKSRLYPGVLECLEGFKKQGVALSLVTNKPMEFTQVMLSGFGLTDFFDVVLGGDSLAQKKPDPLPLIETMRRVGVTKGQTLMVGDSINDVRAARAAGCAVVCVSYGYNYGEAIALSSPDNVVERLDQLL